jgi:hypothetical protein
MEDFKDVKGYEGLYQVSNHGRIRSLVLRNGEKRILKPTVTSSGYMSVSLCKNKVKKTASIHRLVAVSFLGESSLCVNHKDGNKSNNNVENLEWLTYSDNINHGIKMGLIKPNTKKIAQEKRKVVLQINPHTNEIVAIYSSAHEAAAINKYNRGNICSCCRGEKQTAHKYQWRYDSQ